MVEHTQGPWELVANSWAITTIYAPDKQGIICELTLSEDDVDENNQEEMETQQAANAQLIAAAPELLEALQKIRAIFQDMTRGPEITMRDMLDIDILAGKAIAKAKAA